MHLDCITLKLHSKFYGPFRVVEKIGQVAYKLLLPNGCQIHHVFHVSRLKKHVGPRVVPSTELPFVDLEGDILTGPLAIVERRVVPRNNKPMVQWVNLPVESTTWEDADFISKVFPNFHP